MNNQASLNLAITGPIRVNTIQRNSGIFIGEHNTAIGWSAHGKSNTAFGSIGQANVIAYNFALLLDPDLIDTPIDDRDQHLLYEDSAGETAGANPNIHINAVNVNAMSQNAGIFMGNTQINGMEAHGKGNSGAGDVYGANNLSVGNVNQNYDPDLIDAIINDQDNKTAFINRSCHGPP
jgi:hypothetical protein